MNYLAILVATIGAFAVGALWYGPLFGKQWKVLMGFSDEAMSTMKMSAVQAMSSGFVATLVLVYVLANFMAVFGPLNITAAVMFAFWIWLGFIATTMINSVFYENRPWKLYFINATHYLVALLVAAMILFYWM